MNFIQRTHRVKIIIYIKLLYKSCGSICKKAPVLINEQLVLAMKPNSVIIDLAVANGGNCVYSKINEVVVKNQVKIVGFTNLINKCSYDASKLYSKNLS